MTTFDDLTRSFNDGLSKVTSYIPLVISNFQSADSQFRGRKNQLVESYDVKFAGMGAMMFAQAVENNIEITSRMEQKLSDFVTASNHTNQEIDSANQQYGDQINKFVYYDNTEGLSYYGYSLDDVTNQLRDGTLSVYIDIGGVLDFSQQFLLEQLDQAKAGILGDLQFQYSDHIQQYLDEFNRLKSHMQGNNPAQVNEYKQMYDQQVQQENIYLDTAKNELEYFYNNQHSAFSDWYTAIVTIIGTYKNEIAWASATGEVSVGNLLQNLIHAPNSSPIVIYRTNDGGLVVAVNSMNNNLSSQQNALLVQQAIQNYDSLNNITNPKVTILGYKGGNDIVQSLAKDNNPFQISNVVLVGAKISQMPQIGVNYTDYVAPGDDNAGTGNASIVPHSAADKANLGVDAGEIVLGAAGGVPGVLIATGEVITSIVVPIGLNSDSGDVSGAANEGLYFDTPLSLSPNQTVGHHDLVAVPNEPGESSSSWKLTPEFPFVRGKDVDYTQSTYLDMMGLPDPKTGKTLQGFDPLTPPTYFDLPSQ
jgi:hypothetical protein